MFRNQRIVSYVYLYMRKEIELTQEALQQLRILAAHKAISPKRYIEQLVLSHLITESSKPKKK